MRNKFKSRNRQVLVSFWFIMSTKVIENIKKSKTCFYQSFGFPKGKFELMSRGQLHFCDIYHFIVTISTCRSPGAGDKIESQSPAVCSVGFEQITIQYECNALTH